jgi:gluconate kinase
MIEGDALHPPTERREDASGDPVDRRRSTAWLASLALLLAEPHERDVARSSRALPFVALPRHPPRAVPADETFAIELDADAATLRTRIASRTGHFIAG